MARDVNAQLRITTWPAIPLPLPNASRVGSQLDAAREVLLPRAVPLRGGTPRDYCFESAPTVLPGETYLRLCELTLDDPEAILSFVNEYGTLGGARAYTEVV